MSESRKLTFSETLFCGGISGAIAKTLIAPLDRQKILFQVTKKGFSFPTAFKALRITYDTRGFKALYKGNGAMMIRIIPYAAIQYSSHEEYKKISKEYFNLSVSPITRFICGASAGATSVILTYPLDLMRARLAYNNYTQPNIFSIIKSIVQTEGAGSLFQGIKPTVIGQIAYSGLSFCIFESFKDYLIINQSKELTITQRFYCGAFAGLLAQTMSYPLDVVRRRMQIDPYNQQRYTGIINALSTIYKEEGLKRGLYKGVSMNWLKGPIAVGCSFTIYESLRSWMVKNHN